MFLKPKKARRRSDFVSHWVKYLAKNYSYDELTLFDGRIPSRAEYDAAREIEREQQKSPAIF